MTPAEIIAMAREAGFIVHEPDPATIYGGRECSAELVRFAALLAAKEREACAQLAGDSYYGNPGKLNHEIAAAIRARGQKEELV